jgi:ABC-type nitrate/sulfonate/bicarbonate transport system substrate-binding protein
MRRPLRNVHVLLVTLLVAAAQMDGRFSFAAESTQKVRFDHASRSNSNAPKLIAQSKGFFRAEGLDAEMIQMNPRLAATALVSGEAAFPMRSRVSFVESCRGCQSSLSSCIKRRGRIF